MACAKEETDKTYTQHSSLLTEINITKLKINMCFDLIIPNQQPFPPLYKAVFLQ